MTWILRTCLLAGAVLAATLVVAAGAAAHTCTEGTTAPWSHGDCNGHSCPDDGKLHKHKTIHTGWWDHECEAVPSPDPPPPPPPPPRGICVGSFCVRLEQGDVNELLDEVVGDLKVPQPSTDLRALRDKVPLEVLPVALVLSSGLGRWRRLS